MQHAEKKFLLCFLSITTIMQTSFSTTRVNTASPHNPHYAIEDNGDITFLEAHSNQDFIDPLATRDFSDNVPNTLVARNALGNFAASNIFANLIGNVTGNITGTAGAAITAHHANTSTFATTAGTVNSFTGTAGAAIYAHRATTADMITNFTSTVGAALYFAGIHQSNAVATNTPSSIVTRNNLGDFAANTITGNLTGAASSNVLKAGDIMTGSLSLIGSTSNLLVDGNTIFGGKTTFTNGAPGVPKNILFVTKGPISGPGHFNSIKAAVDSITDSSISNPYVIRVGPGIFIEDTITMKPYVAVVGDAVINTVIEVDDPSKNIIIGSAFSIIEKCYLRGATNPGSAALIHNGTGTMRITNCRFGSSDTLVQSVASSFSPATALLIEGGGIDTTAVFRTGFSVTSATPGESSGRAVLVINNFIWQTNLSLNPFDSFVNIHGQNINCQCNNLLIGKPWSLDTHLTGTAFTVYDGATLRVSQSLVSGFDCVFNGPHEGAGQSFFISDVVSHENTHDLHLAHDEATVLIAGGIFARSKMTINNNASTALFIVDPENHGSVTVGPQYIGNTVDTITNITPLTQQGAPLGVINGGKISKNTGLQIAITAGSGYLMIGTAPNDDLEYVTWNAQQITLPATQEGWIYVDNTGTAQFTTSHPHQIKNIILGKARTDASTVLYIQETPFSAAHTSTAIEETLTKYFGPIFANGSIVSKNGIDQLNVSAGEYALGTSQYAPIGGTAIDWIAFYRNGMGGVTTTAQNKIDCNHYDDGSDALAAIPDGKFARHALYILGDGPTEKYLLRYGQTLYNTLAEAQAGNVPPAVPTWSGNIVIIASIIVQNTNVPADRIAEIRDERPRLNFKASSVSVITNHADLTGLLNDEHPQYLLANGTRTMTGNLNMDGHNIITTGLVDGVDVSNHASRHLPGNGADALPTGSPVSIATSNSAGIASSFSRSDHIHAHGNLPGASLHALATETTSGFMSALDKTIINSATTLNRPNTVVQRDTLGNFSANSITANLIGSITGTANSALYATQANIANLAINFTGTAGTAITAHHADTATFATTANAANLAHSFTGTAGASIYAHQALTALIANSANTADFATNFTGTARAAVYAHQAEKALTADTATIANFASTLTGTANAATYFGGIHRSKVLATATPYSIPVRDASGDLIAKTFHGNFTGPLIGNVIGNVIGHLNGNANTATFATNASTASTADFAINFTGTAGAAVYAHQADNATFATTAGSANSANTADFTSNFTGTAGASLYFAGLHNSKVVSTNTPNTIVKRDASGNFSANTITANITGNLTGNVTGNLFGNATTATNFTGTAGAAIYAHQALTALTANSANTAISAHIADFATNFTGTAGTAVTAHRADTATFATTADTANLVNSFTGTAGASLYFAGLHRSKVVSTNHPNTIVRRNAVGSFSANTITADIIGKLTGNVTGNLFGNATTATTATNFTGTAGAAVYAHRADTATFATTVGTANFATNFTGTAGAAVYAHQALTALIANSANTATTAGTANFVTNFTGTAGASLYFAGLHGSKVVSTNNPNTIVKRDASGNFSANTITANITGNLTGNVTGNLFGNATTATTATTALTANSAANFTGSNISSAGNFAFNTAGSTPLNAIGSLASISKQCIISGSANTQTQVTTGTGFTYEDEGSTGKGTIHFDTPFTTPPVIIITPLRTDGKYHMFGHLTDVSSSCFTFNIYTDGGRYTDATVYFVAIGTVN